MKIFGWKSAGRALPRPGKTHVPLTRPFGARWFGSGGGFGEKRAALGLATVPEISAVAANTAKNKSGILELKFNPWHDTQNGKFTREGQGARYGSGGGFGGGGASGSWDKPKPKPSGGFGGGQSGGGGASGSWDKPKPKISVPKREQVKPSVAKPVSRTATTPKKPKTRKVEASGYHFELDEQNRTVRARGELRLDPTQKRDDRAQTGEGRPDRLGGDHGGHFIGRQFGGPKEALNLFAQDANFNRSGYAKLENEWRRSLKAGKKVEVDIQAYYAKNSKRPDIIEVSYYINGKRTSEKFPNKNRKTVK